ncbi:transmembrane domain-containing protein [Hypoxylon cercidicola]|nr:transmembrane domain-containing protein [Hypoxylon cercidicola]
MDTLQSFLPPAKGYLPYYMLITSILAVGNTIQSYMTLHYSRRIYGGKFVPNSSLPAKSATFDPDDSTQKLVPASTSNSKEARAQDQVTPLAARLFGTYTIISSIVRIYASYNLHIAPVYNITLWTYVVALAHFGSECLVYKTAHFAGPVGLTFFFASVGITWMASQYSFYVEM